LISNELLLNEGRMKMAQPNLPEPAVAPLVEASAPAVEATPLRNVLPQDAPETDFSAILEAADADTDVVSTSVIGAAKPAPAEPAPPTEPAVVAQPKIELPTVVVPPTMPVVASPAAPEVLPVVVPAPAPVSAPVELALTEDQVKVKRGELISAFASNYKLSDDDKVKLLSDPDEVLPRLAGNIAVDVLESVTRVVLGNIPQMIQASIQQTEVARSARDAFFGEFPDLNKFEYVPILQQVTQMYRQMNPKVPYAAAATAVGQHARIMLGLVAAPGKSPVVPPTTSPKPAMPLQPGAAASRMPVVAANEWDTLARFEPIDT
jgi:hypothetical protein